MRLFISMEASETSNVGIAVYDDKEAADRAVEKRKKRMAGEGFSDNFSHEGEVIAFYADNQQIDNLIQSISWFNNLIPQRKVSPDQTRQRQTLRKNYAISFRYTWRLE